MVEIRSTVSALNELELIAQLMVAKRACKAADIKYGFIDKRIGSDDLDGVKGWVVRETVANIIKDAQSRRCLIVVEDQTLVHQALAALFSVEGDILVAGRCGSAAALLLNFV